MVKGGRKALSYSRILINAEEKMKIRKSTFGNHHHNNWFIH